MNGNSAFITRGADIAFSRGMIIVNAAGNSGSSSWHYIMAPADGFDVISIGAVDSNKNITSFSSFGPTFDGRIKPDVTAKGGGATIINSLGIVDIGSGTSFASPIICGVIACFWQAYPDKTNAEIVQMIKESAHLYSSPTDQDGYGIPNFETAFNALAVNDMISTGFSFYPNPFNDKILFEFRDDLTELEISIFNILGKKLSFRQVSKQNPIVSLNNLMQGIYIMRVDQEGQSNSFKIIKR